MGMVDGVGPAYHGCVDRRAAVAPLAVELPLRELVMASTGAEEPNSLQGLPLDLIRRAVGIYLGIAYPESEPPPAVRRRLDWTPGLAADELLARPPFERVNKSLTDKPIYALRLGNTRYPHMKLQIQPWDDRHGYLLSVNTHDHALAPDPNSPDAAAFMALQAENQRLKVEIEQAWDEAGLPTFPRYLRDYLAGQMASHPPDSIV
jgi:hypothetical protein